MVSPSTLIRRAAKAKTKAEAVKLRKQAALLRRKSRKAVSKAATGPETEHFGLGTMQSAQMLKEVITDRGDVEVRVSTTNGGVPSYRFDDIKQRLVAALDTTKDDYAPGMFAIELHNAMLEAGAEARGELGKTHVEELKRNFEAFGINIVSAFIAEIGGIARLNNGTLPPVLMVSGLTVARVVAALKDAGYTEEGKGGANRQSINRR